MKNLITILALSFMTLTSFAEDQILKTSVEQFGEALRLNDYNIVFKRDGKQYRIALPFQVNEETTKKLLKMVDVKNVSKYIPSAEVEKYYMEYITKGNNDKYYDGSVKQWSQLEDSDKEDFQNNKMKTMKNYSEQLEGLSFTNVMEMLINSSGPASNDSKKDCNCIDFNGVQIKSCKE